MARKITGLSNVPVSSPSGSTSHSVSSRPIDGGYLVTESSYGPNDYSSKEYFSKTAPKCQVQSAAGSVGDEGLASAIAECKS